MPYYDYKCNACNYEFEEFQKMDSVDIPTFSPCPSCNKGSVSQMLGASPTIDSVRLGIRKPDREFQREIIGRMKDRTPHNNIGKSKFSKFDIPGRIG